MSQIIHFKCRNCASQIEIPPVGTAPVSCPECGRGLRLRTSPAIRSGDRVDVCAVCGHGDMYVQKDFNRALGLAIVVAGVLLSLVFFARREPLYAMLALVGMAAVDAAIYFLIGEATVCYSCHAVYRGFGPNPDHAAFDLELLERYGGRDPRP